MWLFLDSFVSLIRPQSHSNLLHMLHMHRQVFVWCAGTFFATVISLQQHRLHFILPQNLHDLTGLRNSFACIMCMLRTFVFLCIKVTIRWVKQVHFTYEHFTCFTFVRAAEIRDETAQLTVLAPAERVADLEFRGNAANLPLSWLGLPVTWGQERGLERVRSGLDEGR